MDARRLQATNPRAIPRPLMADAACDIVESWLDATPTWVPQPTASHAEVFAELVRNERLSGNLVPDAHLAAIAIQHGLELCSADTDFARFPQLRWYNPLAGG